VDKDGDGEISYSELLDAIDDYFNNESDFTANDVYELNDFFFAQ
jgi:Ca2+-binding EF-hand superfamily protein